MTSPAERNAEAAKRIRNRGISLLRTGIPVAWGYVLTFVADHLPAVSPLLDEPQVFGAVGAVVTFTWYAIMRAVEPRLPSWLTALVLGASSVPLYVDPKPWAGYVPPVIPSQGDRS